MLCCQKYNTCYCNHGHKCHWRVFRYHKCFLPHLTRTHSLRYQGCTCVHCMLHHTIHHLAPISNNQNCSLYHNLRDQTRILESCNRRHSNQHHQPIRMDILMIISPDCSHYKVRILCSDRLVAQYSEETCHNCNLVSCIPDHNNRLLTMLMVTPYFRSFPSSHTLVR